MQNKKAEDLPRKTIMIEDVKQELLVVGMKQTLKHMSENRIALVFVALDADSFVAKEIVSTAESLKIPISYVESMKRLGKRCGIDIGASCAGVLLMPNGTDID